MNEEKKQILKMLEEGKISSEEAMKLLEALEKTDGSEELVIYNEKGKRAKWLKIFIIDTEKDAKVKVNLPIGLLKTGVKIGTKFSKEFREALEGVDLDDIFEEIKKGAKGKIVDIEAEGNKRVEVYVE
ncbi:MAG: hypothetical protein PWP46_1655 [Fusobacteriaceae bacterium]|jgi:NCAIR mutase (PurE)-related protein|nr:hypothetical protein [Fusobacteriaceae bacterium]